MNRCRQPATAIFPVKAHSSRTVAAAFLVGLFAIGLGGCGGGGGETSSTTTSADQGPTVSLQAAAAYFSQRAENRPFTVSGSRSDPASASAPATVLTGSGVLTRDVAAPAVFEGAPVLKIDPRVVSGTVIANGQSTPLAATTVTYANPSSLATVARQDDGVLTRIAPYQLPSAVRIGSSGNFGNGTSDALPLGVTATSYAIGRDTSTSVLLTVVDTVTVAGVPVTDVRTVTRIHLDGSAELVSITTEKFNLGRLFETVVFTFG